MLGALKVLARSHSMDFTRSWLSLGSPRVAAGEAQVTWWSGDGRPVHYRPGTVDVEVVYQVLFKGGRKAEYWLPEALQPKRILDIGGNIGATARYLSHRFPEAEIHCFEPIPRNCELLTQNLRGSSVRIHPYGLGATSGTFEFRQAAGSVANPAGFSLVRSPEAGGAAVRAEVRAVEDVLRSLGEPIDIIKIDVEGAEYGILDAFPDRRLAETTWIYGELHSEMADASLAFALLSRLARWFDIEVHKSLRKRNWFFDACNKRVSDRFRGFRRRR